jgi:hypothetical protein
MKLVRRRLRRKCMMPSPAFGSCRGIWRCSSSWATFCTDALGANRSECREGNGTSRSAERGGQELNIDWRSNFKKKNPRTTVITTGHGLGAGLATLCAHDLQCSGI